MEPLPALPPQPGTRLRVWWEGNCSWHKTTVLDWIVAFDAKGEGLQYRIRCQYDGGVMEHSLSDTRFEIISSPSPKKPQRRSWLCRPPPTPQHVLDRLRNLPVKFTSPSRHQRQQRRASKERDDNASLLDDSKVVRIATSKAAARARTRAMVSSKLEKMSAKPTTIVTTMSSVPHCSPPMAESPIKRRRPTSPIKKISHANQIVCRIVP
uniref:Uncharacterized protein n=1 Tax=Haptolina brevifila TaxID=156173 RepID=A0A7S2IZN1_9EUKA